MLSKEVFKKGIEDLRLAFPEFEMTKERAELWYNNSCELFDREWQDKITNCIRYCIKKSPLLADILDLKKVYVDNSTQYPAYQPEKDDYEYKPMPKNIREKMNMLKQKWTSNL